MVRNVAEDRLAGLGKDPSQAGHGQRLGTMGTGDDHPGRGPGKEITGHLAGRGAPHAIGHQEKAALRVSQPRILVVAAPQADIAPATGRDPHALLHAATLAATASR